MARNGLKAVDTGEGEDLYDSLSQDAQDQWDTIGALGFTPEKGAAGLWFARKPGQQAKDAIGPADSLSSLLSQVRSIADIDDVESFDEESDEETSGSLQSVPSTRLPGMEEPEIEALDNQADVVMVALERKKKAAAEYKDQDEIMRRMLRDHGRKRYSRRGYSIVIEETEKLVIKEEKQKKPKDESGLKAAA